MLVVAVKERQAEELGEWEHKWGLPFQEARWERNGNSVVAYKKVEGRLLRLGETKKKFWYLWRGLKLKRVLSPGIKSKTDFFFLSYSNLTSTMQVEEDQGKLLWRICRISNTSLLVQQKAVGEYKDVYWLSSLWVWYEDFILGNIVKVIHGKNTHPFVNWEISLELS